MKPRERLIAGLGLAAAIVAGWDIAEGSFALVGLLGAIAVLFAVNRLLRVEPAAALAGFVLVGYLVANRGFAQLHPPAFPLLPAELALGLALMFGLWRWSHDQQLPVRRDALNLGIATWVVLSAIRLPFDFRSYGFIALRDFAMVYYAVFFFLAQDWALDPANRRFLERCLVVGLALCTPAFWAFTAWPEWFETHLTIAGNPLLYVKSDVAGGFMAGAVFLFLERFNRRRHPGWLALALVALAGVATSNSRAAAVAVVGAAGWLVVLRRWRTLRMMAALLLLGLVALAGQSLLTRQPFVTTPLYRAYEDVASVVDFTGTRTYRSAELGDKPDNNQFRMVWWRTVVTDTWQQGRWLGLGFGADLAEDFLRAYSPSGDEEFTARSPHNFALSIFARTGIVGFVAFLGFFAAWWMRTWHAGRPAPELGDAPSSRLEPTSRGDATPSSRFGPTSPGDATPSSRFGTSPGDATPPSRSFGQNATGASRPQESRAGEATIGWWLVGWCIFISACFGVVLEGPMSAVVFWTVLGLANAATGHRDPAPALSGDATPSSRCSM